MTHKKLVSVVAFMLLASLCLFAEPQEISSASFRLRHNVNANSQYYFEFWDPETGRQISEASMDSAGMHVFATLMIIYNSEITLKSIEVKFTDLVNTVDETIFYPYKMEVFKPESTTKYGKITLADGMHGAGSCVLFDENTSFSKWSTNVWDTDEICDFAITLDDSDVPVGIYEGSIQYIITAK